ncbi:MAG: hypothetical protein ACLRSW_10160 [Christensenellaceae bacterium]
MNTQNRKGSNKSHLCKYFTVDRFRELSSKIKPFELYQARTLREPKFAVGEVQSNAVIANGIYGVSTAGLAGS